MEKSLSDYIFETPAIKKPKQVIKALTDAGISTTDDLIKDYEQY